MGTFAGHVAPGAYLALMAIWWSVEILMRYHKSKQNGTQFRSSPSFKCQFLCGRLKHYEVDGALKTIASIILFTCEVTFAFRDGKFVYYTNGQHATIFFVIGISGIVDLLRHHKFPVPEEASYSVMFMLLVVELVLFNYHLHVRNRIYVLIHNLMLYVLVANIFAVAAEICYRNSVMVAISRCYLFMLQGVWFIAIGFIMYNPIWKPNWDPENHDHFMLATMLFTWFILAVGCFIIFLNCFIGSRVNMKSPEIPYLRLVNDGHESGGLVSQKNADQWVDMPNDADDFESQPPQYAL